MAREKRGTHPTPQRERKLLRSQEVIQWVEKRRQISRYLSGEGRTPHQKLKKGEVRKVYAGKRAGRVKAQSSEREGKADPMSSSKGEGKSHALTSFTRFRVGRKKYHDLYDKFMTKRCTQGKKVCRPEARRGGESGGAKHSIGRRGREEKKKGEGSLNL